MKLQNYQCDVCGTKVPDPNPAATVRFPEMGEVHLCPDHREDVKAILDDLLEEHDGNTMPPAFAAQ